MLKIASIVHDFCDSRPGAGEQELVAPSAWCTDSEASRLRSKPDKPQKLSVVAGLVDVFVLLSFACDKRQSRRTYIRTT